MCISVCVHLYVYICMCTSVCVHLYVYICMCTSVCVHLYVYICMCTSVCVHLYVYICMCTSVCVHLYVYICMCTSVCVHLYVYICMYISVCVYLYVQCLSVSLSTLIRVVLLQATMCCETHGFKVESGVVVMKKVLFVEPQERPAAMRSSVVGQKQTSTIGEVRGIEQYSLVCRIVSLYIPFSRGQFRLLVVLTLRWQQYHFRPGLGAINTLAIIPCNMALTLASSVLLLGKGFHSEEWGFCVWHEVTCTCFLLWAGSCESLGVLSSWLSV